MSDTKTFYCKIRGIGDWMSFPAHDEDEAWQCAALLLSDDLEALGMAEADIVVMHDTTDEEPEMEIVARSA